MMRQAQIKDGFVCSDWIGDGVAPVPPDESWIFLDVTDRPEAVPGGRYDVETDTFAPPMPSPILSKADVIAALTPEAWAELNKYHPKADPPYDDPEVFYAMSLLEADGCVNLDNVERNVLSRLERGGASGLEAALRASRQR